VVSAVCALTFLEDECRRVLRQRRGGASRRRPVCAGSACCCSVSYLVAWVACGPFASCLLFADGFLSGVELMSVPCLSCVNRLKGRIKGKPHAECAMPSGGTYASCARLLCVSLTSWGQPTPLLAAVPVVTPSIRPASVSRIPMSWDGLAPRTSLSPCLRHRASCTRLSRPVRTWTT